jgi:hypothetical protein
MLVYVLKRLKMLLIYINYKIYLKDKTRGGVGIGRDGLYVLLPLFSGVSWEREEILGDFKFCCVVLI